ncbi:cadherin-like beta sandwich domain-containing protein [Cohnella hashimotonis]|uniref:Cadherin-like beta sandwich domain-containing protein n=1 Tax=Cohnella hashimotonis TaxID=2826895 RepID=A0ABT6TJB7_9BACL|nr:cadherin-like beta sandwich domain-containing protein [Cohnella hashimotonis]MDI4645942.1 cadherin-like beta sandwich domain-containing protein [Cohnella hashimotonis]
MIRSWGIFALVFLLIVVPVSVPVGGSSAAAASSRIAVIRSLSGDVQVQKAGGAKTFKAFAKLSLNQGDKLMTGSDGAAELQFANGTSEDDLLSVGDNATLSFSKLSDKKGTVTKVSMLRGTAWVDVKSIKSKEDDFRLETPTAVMGVRGTAFYASVHPLSGSTTTAVLSGVVQFGKIGRTASGDTTLNLYPTQEITVHSGDDPAAVPEQTMLMNIGELVRGMPPAVVASLLRSKQKIDDENLEMYGRFAQDKLPAALGASAEDLARFRQNTLDLSGIFAKQALEQKKIDLAQLKQIETEGRTTFNLDKKELQLTEADKEKQAAALEQEAEAVKKQTETDAAKLKSLQGKLAERLQAIEQAKLAQQAANKKAAEEAQAKAEAALLSQLNESQKQQFQTDKILNRTMPSAPVATPAATPTPSSEAKLASLDVSGAALSPAFMQSQLSYSAAVNAGVASVDIRPVALDSAAAIAVNGESLSSGGRTVSLDYGTNVIDIQVMSPDRSTTLHYTVSITRELLGVADIAIGPGSRQIDFASGSLSTPFSVPGDIASIELTLKANEAPVIQVNGTPVSATPALLGTTTADAAELSWRFSLPLQTGNNAIAITATAGGKIKTYMLNAKRLSLNTNLSSLSIKSMDGQRNFFAALEQDGKFKVTVPAAMTEGLLNFWPGDSSSKLILGGSSYDFGDAAPVSLTSDINELRVTIRSQSGATADYTLVLDRIPLGSGGSAALGGIRLYENGSPGAFLAPDANLRMNSEVAVAQSSVTFTISFPENDNYWRYLSVYRMDTNQSVLPDSNARYTIPLSANGDTAIEFRLRSADQSASSIYSWTVKKVIMAQPASWNNVAGQPLIDRLTGSDPAGLPLTYATVAGSGPSFGSLALNPDGTFQYQAAADAQGLVTFDYTVTNGTDISRPATVSILVKQPAPTLAGLDQWNLATNGTPVDPFYMGESPPGSNTFVFAKYVDVMPDVIDLTYSFDNSVQTANLNYGDSLGATHNVDLIAAAGTAALTNLKYGENRIQLEYTRSEGGGATTSYTVQIKLYINSLSLYTPQAISDGTTTPVFMAGMKAYVAAVPAGTGQIRLQLQAADPYSTFEVESGGMPIADDGSGYLAGLSDGWNRITVRLSRLGIGNVVDVYDIDIYKGDDEPSGYSLSLTGTAVSGGTAVAFARDTGRSTRWLSQAPAGSTAIMLSPVAGYADTYIGGVYLMKPGGIWEWVNATAQGSGIYRLPLDGGGARAYILVNKFGRPPLVYEVDITP